ncbi:hypothetical protein BU17DRAFT_63402 [Hysterangium stoloniferum]|nr:hypothetical protein BU17DRAFT_63402 [Hysterangium stoloniferum]
MAGLMDIPIIVDTVMISYDHLLTLPAEIDFVWTAGWSVGKCLYLFTHYFGLITLISYAISAFSEDVAPGLSKNFMVASHRVYAVYHQNKIVLSITAPLSFIGSISPLVGYCLHTPGETVLCGLMVYKSWNVFKYGGNSPLLRTLIYDSLLSIFLMNCLSWSFKTKINSGSQSSSLTAIWDDANVDRVGQAMSEAFELASIGTKKPSATGVRPLSEQVVAGQEAAFDGRMLSSDVQKMDIFILNDNYAVYPQVPNRKRTPNNAIPQRKETGTVLKSDVRAAP